MSEYSTRGHADKAFMGIMRMVVIERDWLLCYDPARYADAS